MVIERNMENFWASFEQAQELSIIGWRGRTMRKDFNFFICKIVGVEWYNLKVLPLLKLLWFRSSSKNSNEVTGCWFPGQFNQERPTGQSGGGRPGSTFWWRGLVCSPEIEEDKECSGRGFVGSWLWKKTAEVLPGRERDASLGLVCFFLMCRPGTLGGAKMSLGGSWML